MTKLPATTEPEIAALPSSEYDIVRVLPDDYVYLDALGRKLLKIDLDTFQSVNSSDVWLSVGQVCRQGGIASRLVDPAPLEALLRGWLDQHEHGCDCGVDEPGTCIECLTKAALSNPEGVEQ